MFEERVVKESAAHSVPEKARRWALGIQSVKLEGYSGRIRRVWKTVIYQYTWEFCLAECSEGIASPDDFVT